MRLHTSPHVQSIGEEPRDEYLKVTVIVPVYNVAPYLTEALDSLIDQNYRNLDIIIIDDGSTDGSGYICDQYASDSRVCVVHQKNRGLSAARNTGLDLMTGDYVAFLDSDDAFHPDMIRIMKNALEHTGADVVTCGYDIYNTASRMTGERTVFSHIYKNRQYSSREALNELITGGLTTAVWDKLYRKELWNNIRFPEGHVYEDVLTTCHVLERVNRIQTLPNRLYLHRKRHGSITKTFSDQNIRDYFHVHHLLEKYVTKNTPEMFSRRNRQIFLQNKLRGEILLSIECLSLLGKSDPVAKKIYRRVRAKAIHTENITGMKTRFVRWAFLYCPGILLPIRKIYVAFKAFVRKVLPL